MRVLLSAVGTRGDIQPMIALALGLRGAGHEVRICATGNGRAMAEAHGLDFIDLGLDIEGLLKNEPDLVQKNLLRSLGRIRALIVEAIDRQFEIHRREMPWAQISVGAGLVVAPGSVAQALQIPYRYAVYCAQAVPSRLHSPYSIRPQNLPGWLNAAAWSANDLLLKQLFGAALNRNRGALSLPPIERMSKALTPKGQLLFCADPELSPPPLDHDADIPICGPLLMPVEGALDPALRAFLDASPKPAYLGFGSMTDGDPTATTKLVLEAAARARVRLVLSAGWANLGGAELPPSCFLIRETPHALLFPKCAAVVHHGGAGTVATASRAGVPQLLIPHVMDQHYWAKHLFRLGLTPRAILRRTLTVDALANGLRELVANPLHAQRASEMGARLRERNGVATAVAQLVAAVQ